MDQIFSKKVLPIKNKKSEFHHWILQVRINVGTKFQFRLIILIFWTKFAQIWLFPLKNKKSEEHHWILRNRVRLGAIFLGAMAPLGQSREIWPSMAPLGYVDLTKMQKLLKSKNKNENEKQNKNNENSFFFFHFSFCFHFRFCLCFCCSFIF